MRYIIFFLIALCAALPFLLGYKNERAREIEALKAKDRIHTRQIVQLQADMEFHNQNAQRVIDEVRHIMSGKNFIPVYDWRTFLVWDVKEMEGKSP